MNLKVTDSLVVDAPRPAFTVLQVVLLALLTALNAFSIDMYLPGMPEIAREMAASPSAVQNTVVVFLIGMGIGQALYGPLLDRFGRRVPLLLGVSLFVLGSLMCALAPDVQWLLAARFVQALGAAAGMVTPRAVIADRSVLPESARVFSLLMQVMMVVPILAPLIGGVIVGHASWRWIFVVLAATGMLALVWSAMQLPETLPPGKRVRHSWTRILGVYARQCTRASFMVYTLASGILFGSFIVFISSSAFVYTGHFGLTPSEFSYVFAANAACVIAGGFVSRDLLRRQWPVARIALLGIAVHALAGLVLSVLIHQTDVTMVLYAGLLVLSTGALGLVIGNLTALTMSHAGTHAGTASALTGMMQFLLSAAIGYIASAMGPSAEMLPTVIGVGGVAGGLLTWLARHPLIAAMEKG
ncbi:hypothetical protein AAV94_06385 [Lampropedia cohaerens]|uniref:Bcr/CflA family efflux transporter n=1 Tax=Lampropedia cohaerens TaxID=1610491 RepID=A0A0U1Q045_9BURK|nr:multidrug effflux MFS transporter [Lampropedia cohaerens]KKW68106.1 hypothetical protein AAV94_06385 [Lampropedia cohaerens]